MYYIYAWYIKAFGFYFGRTGHMYIIYTIFPQYGWSMNMLFLCIYTPRNHKIYPPIKWIDIKFCIAVFLVLFFATNEARLHRFYAVWIEHKQWLIAMIQGLFKHIVSDEQNTFLQEKYVHSNLYARVRILKGVCNATNHFETEEKKQSLHTCILDAIVLLTISYQHLMIDGSLSYDSKTQEIMIELPGKTIQIFQGKLFKKLNKSQRKWSKVKKNNDRWKTNDVGIEKSSEVKIYYNFSYNDRRTREKLSENQEITIGGQGNKRLELRKITIHFWINS